MKLKLWHPDQAPERAAAKLKELRLERGMSQRHLADEAKVDSALVCRLERGRDARLRTWARLYLAAGYLLELTVAHESSEEAKALIDEESERRREKRREALWYGRERR